MCQIVVSDRIGSPIISEADLLLVMDERSLEDYEKMLKKGGILILNSNLIQKKAQRNDIQVLSVPFNDIAMEIGNAKTANSVALGTAMKYLDFVSLDIVKAHLKDIFSGEKGKLITVNEKALDAGFQYE